MDGVYFRPRMAEEKQCVLVLVGADEWGLSRKTALAMAFKLMMSAQTKWRKLDGANRMPEIIEGVEFKDGIKQLQNAA
jgi:hypothetical protein